MQDVVGLPGSDACADVALASSADTHLDCDERDTRLSGLAAHLAQARFDSEPSVE